MTVVEKHQIAGLDDRERGFSRLGELEQIDDLYRARLHYEAVTVVSQASSSASAAMGHLIRLLQDRGYTQLRSRLTFRGECYLGDQEMWTEHPDPAGCRPTHRRLLPWLARLTVTLPRKVSQWFTTFIMKHQQD